MLHVNSSLDQYKAFVKLFLIFYLIIMASGIILSYTTGVNDMQDIVKTTGAVKETLDTFTNNKLSLSIHWGPSSLGANEISWSRARAWDGKEPIAKEEYDQFMFDFAPEFNTDQWTEYAKKWGFKALSPTSKHHDGFCLWPTKWTKYNSSLCKKPFDLLKDLKASCEKHDLDLYSYYSLIDWSHPDAIPYGPGGLPEFTTPDEPFQVNFNNYVLFMKKQMDELVENYGVKLLQFDGEWEKSYTRDIVIDFYNYIRKRHPAVIISSRIDIGRQPYKLDGKEKISAQSGDWDSELFLGDYEERERITFDALAGAEEQGVESEESFYRYTAHPWQAWVTLDKKQWAYSTQPSLQSANDVIRDMVQVFGGNGNFMINIGPDPKGDFPPEQIEIMDKVGSWVKKNSNIIYGSSGGPWQEEDVFTSIKNNGKIYFFPLDTEVKNYVLKSHLTGFEPKTLGTLSYNNKSVDYEIKEDTVVIKTEALKQAGLNDNTEVDCLIFETK